MATARKKPRRKSAARSKGIEAKEMAAGITPADVQALAVSVEKADGAVLSCYREPLGGRWLVLAALPIEAVEPTPYQRDVSDTHVKRLAGVIEKTARFLDPIVTVAGEGGRFWTPNGNHRLQAMRRLGAKAITALIVPEPEVAFQILALNTEKAHSVRERAMEVIRMYRALAEQGEGSEERYEFYFEDPALPTLGICYEKNGRFAGGAYHPVLRRVEEFSSTALGKALKQREEHAERVMELEGHVAKAVEALKQRGFQSPYLRAFVVARINPLRWAQQKRADFDPTFDTMIDRAERFDPGKIREQDLARTGGPPSSTD